MKIQAFFLILLLSICNFSYGQEQAKTLYTQAEKAFSTNNYAQARTSYLKAYQAYASSGKCKEAIECGVKACRTYYMENLYNEAFDLCRGMDAFVIKAEQAQQKDFTSAKIQITLERMLMYMKLKRADQTKQQLGIIEQLTKQDGNVQDKGISIIAQAAYNYAFSSKEQGDKTLASLNKIYKKTEEFQKAGDCYMQLIQIGKAVNNVHLVSNGYEHYMKWKEEQKALTAKDELNVVKREYQAAQQTIQDKDDTISGKQNMIIFLSVVIFILLGIIVVACIIYMRLIAGNKHIRNELKEIQKVNEQKTTFIQNLSRTITPTIDNIAASVSRSIAEKTGPAETNDLQKQVNGLLQFSKDIQTLTCLENSINEPYATTEITTTTLCEQIASLAQPMLKPGVEFLTDVPKLRINANKEEVTNILMHLIYNAAQHTTNGHIRLEFKKRGAHINQFILTDTGTGIAEELQKDLFIPFKPINNMAEGDLLGLPICALKAVKMKGSLKLDTTYKKGARFILEIYG